MFLNFTGNSQTPWSTNQGPDFLFLPRGFPRVCNSQTPVSSLSICPWPVVLLPTQEQSSSKEMAQRPHGRMIMLRTGFGDVRTEKGLGASLLISGEMF